jgi:hypothetical protein
MSKIADYSDPVTVEQLDATLRAGGFDGVFHYLAGNFARRIEDASVVAGIRSAGWPQLGISVPTLGAVDGAADTARVSNVYGFGAGFRLVLDIEPIEFDADPAGWSAAADRWCAAVAAAGLSPGVYGVDRTVAVPPRPPQRRGLGRRRRARHRTPGLESGRSAPAWPGGEPERRDLLPTGSARRDGGVRLDARDRRNGGAARLRPAGTSRRPGT